LSAERLRRSDLARVNPRHEDQFHRPLRDLRISVTDRCNFRCTYCMPKEVFGHGYDFLPRAEILSFEEIARLARCFVTLGVEKVRLTGGEPLLRKNLDRLIAQLAEIERLRDLTLTTNGSLLAQQAKALREAGLRRLTVSLDALDDATFRAMNDVDFPVSRVLDGIDAALAAGFRPLKINAVIRRGVNEHAIAQLAERFGGPEFIVRFIEYMDVGSTNGWRLDDVVPSAEIAARLGLASVAPKLPRRSCTPFPHAGGRRDRADLVGHAAVLRRLHPRAHHRGRTPLYLPLRHARPRLARRAALRRFR
jgi:GTP 3',8-cyclase